MTAVRIGFEEEPGFEGELGIDEVTLNSFPVSNVERIQYFSCIDF